MTRRDATCSRMAGRSVRSGGVATAAFIASALVAPPSALADPPTGSRLGKAERERGVEDVYEARRRALRLAECMYFKRGGDVRGVLTSLSEKDQARFQRNLSEAVECSRANLAVQPGLMGSMVITSPDVMRGNYAEAAMAKMTEDDGLQPIAASSAEGVPPPSHVRDWFVLTGRHPVTDSMAVCVAEQNPAAIRGLIATRPETAEEKAAIQAIAPSLGPCLPQGATLKANRQSLRAALAEALYHRAVAPDFVTAQK